MFQAKLTVPIAVNLTMAYIFYAAGHVIGYKETYLQHLKAAAWVLWIALAFCGASFYIYWLAVVLRGPGTVPPLPLMDLVGTATADPDLQYMDAPMAFLCDQNGYPFWCSHCQQPKPERAFHLSNLNRCVPRFDHYCIWIGTVIGRDNYVFFSKFVISALSFLLFILAYLAATTSSAFQHPRSSRIVPHYIILYCLCVIFIPMTGGLVGTVLFNVKFNDTMLDNVSVTQARAFARWRRRQDLYTKEEANSNDDHVSVLKRLSKRVYGLMQRCPKSLRSAPRVESGIRYVNILSQKNRHVVSYKVKAHPYTLGYLKNLQNICMNGNRSVSTPSSSLTKSLMIFCIPFIDLFYLSPTPTQEQTYELFSDEFCPRFLKFCEKQISKGRAHSPQY